ncbi:MAG: response regulator, partial [Pseudomonadales bacterium]
EADRLEVEEIECAAHEVIAESVKVLKVKAEEKGIYLNFEPEGMLPETVLSDSSRLRQIVTNLVGNAIKFTDQGGVTVSLQHVEQGGENLLKFDISDTGIGMQQDRLESIFDPFVQADSSVSRQFGGTGLGLSISKRFAEALGGGIVVSSEPGVGSNFSCTIRTGDLTGVALVPAVELMSRIQSTGAVTTVSWLFPDSRVLVVDDGEENRELVRLVLEENGLNVDEACNGQEGVELALNNNYDIVLMDVQMPVMDGFEATRMLRSKNYDVPIVALTANAMKGFEQQCLDAGYTSYMSKPINIDKLLASLADYLGATESDEPLANAGIPILHAAPLAGDADFIYSRLTDARFKKLIEQFKERLAVQMAAMHKVIANEDYAELANLAHWLKGAGGTVGFDAFTDPAAELELAAKAADRELVAQFMAVISDFETRLSVEQVDPETASRMAQRREYVDAEAANDALTDLINDNGPLLSRFAGDARMQPLIEKFQTRLVGQLALMHEQCEANAFGKLADLAHWLKGAGGTIGFDVFTEPAADLETYAKQQDQAECRDKLAQLDSLILRISNASEDGNITGTAS